MIKKIMILITLLSLMNIVIGGTPNNEILGVWSIDANNNLQGLGNNGNAILLFSDKNLGDTQVKFTLKNSDTKELQNGFFIFDYKNETDFKYAGMRINDNRFTIGHYDGNWKDSITRKETLSPNKDYLIEIEIKGGKIVLNVNGKLKIQKDYPININEEIGLANNKASSIFKEISIESKDSNSESRIAQVYTIEKTNTGFDEMMDIIEKDPGLLKKVPGIDIQEAKYSLNEMNGVILKSIRDLAMTNDGEITALEMKLLNKYVYDNYGEYWNKYHGDDETIEETGFHLVQNDGSQTIVLRRNAINTIIDGILHLGYAPKFEDRFQNEDGNRNQKYSDVADWVEYFLANDMKDLENPNAKLNYNLNIKSGEIMITGENTFLLKDETGNGLILLEDRELDTISNIKFSLDSTNWNSNSNGFLIFDYVNENDFKYIGVKVNEKLLVTGHYNGKFNDEVTLKEDMKPNVKYDLEVKIENSQIVLYVNGEKKLTNSIDKELGNNFGFLVNKATSIISNVKISNTEIKEEIEIVAQDAYKANNNVKENTQVNFVRKKFTRSESNVQMKSYISNNEVEINEINNEQLKTTTVNFGNRNKFVVQ